MLKGGLDANFILLGLVLLLLLVILPVNSRIETFFGDEESDCQTPNGEPGKCVVIRKCAHLVRNALQPQISASQDGHYEYLKQARCGFRDRDPMICCLIGGTDVNSGTSSTSPRNVDTSREL